MHKNMTNMTGVSHMSFVYMCVCVFVCDVKAEEWKEWLWRTADTAACLCSCGCTILMIFTHLHADTHSHTYTQIRAHAQSLHCQPLVTPGYLTWLCQTNHWCQRQCSCCNLGQAIYKASSQVQAQGARGRQRDGRIKEYLQGKETDLQSVGEKEQERRREAGGTKGIKVVRGWVKIEKATQEEMQTERLSGAKDSMNTWGRADTSYQL